MIAWGVWIALAVVASLLPFLFELRFWTAGGDAIWACEHGAVSRASVERSSVNPVRGEDLWLVEWNPGMAASLDFQWGPTSDVEPRPTPASRPFVRRAPPWAVLLMPTLLVVLLARPARWLARWVGEQCPRGLAYLREWPSAQRRALLKAGRVPCPSCDHDVTGLERCPECGTLARAVRPSPLGRLRPPRIALVAWLGVAGAASLMPFLVIAYGGWGGLHLGFSQGSAEILYERNWAGPNTSGFYLRPGLLHMFSFDGGWTAGFLYVQFPPWLVLFVPTLVAMVVAREVRYARRRRLEKLGRSQCPSCGYDATGLEVCPECGAAVRAAAG
jgi:hypothetical protein